MSNGQKNPVLVRVRGRASPSGSTLWALYSGEAHFEPAKPPKKTIIFARGMHCSYILKTKGSPVPLESADGGSREAATILVADDEPAVRLVAAAILTRCGHRVLTAPDGDEALQVFENAKNTIHLVLSDYVMPGINGYQLLHSIRNLSPSTAVLLMSASWPSVSQCGVAAIAKPFTQETLIEKVGSLLAGCDFAQIEREQASARSQRRAARLGT